MPRPAVVVPNDPVPLVRWTEDLEVLGNPRLEHVWTDDVAGAYVPELLARLAGSPRATVRGVRDDNRSAILTVRAVLGDTEYALCVKGCGAEYDAFDHAPLTPARLRTICRDPALRTALDDGLPSDGGFITAERWFGNTPYGAQAPDNAALALLTSLRADPDHLAGLPICPVVAAVRLPPSIARIASRFYWYRRYEGTYWQEVRLMPSNVRLYFHSPVTFGIDTADAFALFGLESYEASEAFLGNLAASCLAALTLYARTLRPDPRTGGYLGLGYHDVWLDKDAVIAPDGSLHFADLEGIEDVPSRGPDGVREAIRSQFHRNLYEATFALEAMSAEVQRRWRPFADDAERRAWLLGLVEDACRRDPYLRAERDGDRLVLHVEPATDADACGCGLEWASGEASP